MKSQDLKDWRASLGITQDQAAFLLGLTRAGYQHRERGPTPLTIETRYATLYLAEHPEEVKERLLTFKPTQGTRRVVYLPNIAGGASGGAGHYEE